MTFPPLFASSVALDGGSAVIDLVGQHLEVLVAHADQLGIKEHHEAVLVGMLLLARPIERSIPPVVAREDQDRVIAQPQRIEFVQQDLEVAVNHLYPIRHGTAVR